MPTRRRFLVVCSVLAAGSSLAPAAGFGARRFRPREVSLDQISFAAFASQVGTTFEVTGATDLQLVKAEPLAGGPLPGSSAVDLQNEQFALLFAGPATIALPQDTYEFIHPVLGRFAMFIAAVGPREPQASYYQAVFNRLVPGRPRGRGFIAQPGPVRAP